MGPRSSAGSARRADALKPAELAKYFALELSRRVYRWTRSNLHLERRAKVLKEALDELPRLNIGVRLGDLDPGLDRSLAALREKNRELVIGDFDQDGGLLPRFGSIAGVPAIAPGDFLPRSGCPVLLVDLNGRLGVRKEFKSFGRFVQEIEAMLQLEASNCPVPKLMNVDWETHALTMTYVPGDVVRELLAVAGANIRDRDSKTAYTRSIDKERIRSGREILSKVLTQEDVLDVAAGLNAIHDAGFVLEDVKFGNIILPQDGGQAIFVDLERALPTSALPSGLADHLRQIDIKKFKEHFGEEHELECYAS